MESENGLLLIFCVLCTEAVECCAESGKLCMLVAIGAGLGRTPTGAGDGVPRRFPTKRCLIWSPGSRVTIDNQPRLTLFGKINGYSGGST